MAGVDYVDAEHDGYERLAQPVTHRRSVRFHKRDRFWLIEDLLIGEGQHDLFFRFHCAPEVDVTLRSDGILELCDRISHARLLVALLQAPASFELEPTFVSRDYGAKQSSVSACWSERADVPLTRRWAIVPLRANENETGAVESIAKLRETDSDRQPKP